MARWTSRAGLSSNPRCSSFRREYLSETGYPAPIQRALSRDHFLLFLFFFYFFLFFSNAVLRFDNLINGHVLLETRVCAKPTEGGIRTNPRTNERGQRKRKGTSSRGKKCTRVHSVEFQKGKGENEFREEALRPSALLSFASNKRPLRWLINGLTGREVGTIAFPLNLGQCPNAPSDESINSCSPAFLFLSSLFSFFLSFFFPRLKQVG